MHVLQLTSSRGEPTHLSPLSWVNGHPVGSALIDINFHHFVSDRLRRIRDYLQGDPNIIAYRMMQGRFERFKCSYGTKSSYSIPTIPLSIPGLGPGKNFPNVNIEDSTMKITKYVTDMADEDRLCVVNDSQGKS